MAVNCAAIPDELVESELFGHEKGAFTGALERKIGRFELAHRGTLFLDEIGDMSLNAQAKILRVLQDGAIQRVGGLQTIPIDIRVIAATNKDLSQLMEANRFRKDLYYRLNVIPISIPPLHERKSDIRDLVDYFLRRFGGGRIPQLTEEHLLELEHYEWPGNIRELKNWAERACIFYAMGESHWWTLYSPSTVGMKTLVEEKPMIAETTPSPPQRAASSPPAALRHARVQFERDLIYKTLEDACWNITKAAGLLGVERSHLHKKMRQLKIEGRGKEALVTQDGGG